MPDHALNVYPILLAGGTGTRLWPASRSLYPKQLIKVMGKDSLVQATIKRLSPQLDLDKARVVCEAEHAHEISRHMKEIGLDAENKIITEPTGRNTAPAILLSVLHVLEIEREKDAIMCVFPADHVINNIENFHENLAESIRLANENYIVTFGIKPHYPETGYGYIETGGPLPKGATAVKRFVEKPDLETAKKYLAAGNFFWNSGMFVFKASVIAREFQSLVPELYESMAAMQLNPEGVTLESHAALPSISIDYAIMEKTDKIVLIASDFGWSDIGSWKSLYDFLPKDENRNVIDGDVILKDTTGYFIMGKNRVENTGNRPLVIVQTSLGNGRWGEMAC